jgi:hypothetical protein
LTPPSSHLLSLYPVIINFIREPKEGRQDDSKEEDAERSEGVR